MRCLSLRFGAKVLRWPIPGDQAGLGAASGNDMVAPFPGISRFHAFVIPKPEGIQIIDRNSKNGIVVDGQRVQETSLRHGKSVRIGRATLSIEDGTTSNVLIALPVRTPVSAPLAETEASEEQSAAGGAALNAIRFIRAVESRGDHFSGKRRQQVMDDARRVVGAETLLLCSAGSSLIVHAIAGSMPEHDAIAMLEGVTRRPRRWSERRVSGGFVAILHGRSSRMVAAVFREAPANWADDFMAFIAEKFLGGSGNEPHVAEAPASEGDLVFPTGMVKGSAPSVKKVLEQVRATVRSRLDVLLLGETGTGKELFARMIHASGPTAAGPFLAVNCAAIPGELLESELFGVHGRVATGVDPRPGLFVQANHGSILLDEIAELPDRLQAKLLRVLQEREVLPIGATAPRKVDLRVISASNRDLPKLVREGVFRADLFYRLRGLQFHIPPLRDRREDIPALVLEFVFRAATEYGKTIQGVSRSALGVLMEHDWPGNVRELESEIRRAVLVCPTGGAVLREHLGTVRWCVDVMSPAAGSLLQDEIQNVERAHIERTLRATGGNKTRAAKLLGITRNGLTLKLRRLGLERS